MERFGERMFGLVHPKHGKQFWTAGRTKKKKICRICNVDIGKSVLAWRPVTNQANRSDRVCSVECLGLYETIIKS